MTTSNLKERIKANSQNNVYMKYTSDSGQCPTWCLYNPLKSHLSVSVFLGINCDMNIATLQVKYYKIKTVGEMRLTGIHDL
jgi:hypothetical protein